MSDSRMFGDTLRTSAVDPLDTVTYDVHAANPCPPLSSDELESLRKSLADNGYVSGFPVVRSAGPACKDQIIDGFHRTQLCAELDLEPATIFQVCDTDTEFRIFQIMANVTRRQLSTVQKAKLGVELISLYSNRAKERMIAGKKLNPTQPVVEGQKSRSDRESLGQAAEAVGVSRETIRQYQQIAESGRQDLVDKVDQGTSIKSAYKQLMEPRTEDLASQKQYDKEYSDLFPKVPSSQLLSEEVQRACAQVVADLMRVEHNIRKFCITSEELMALGSRPHTFNGVAERLKDLFESYLSEVGY